MQILYKYIFSFPWREQSVMVLFPATILLVEVWNSIYSPTLLDKITTL